MTGIVAHTYPEWWLKLAGQVAHWSTDYSNEPVYRDDLIEIVARHYEVEKDVVRDDIDEFLNSLHQEGLIDYNE